MPNTDPSINNNPFPTEQDMSIRIVQWVLTTAAPQGTPVSMAEWADKTIEIDGTSNDPTHGQLSWGGTGVLAVQGSNNGVLGASLQNAQALSNAAGGTALSGISTNKVAAIIENPLYIAPVLTTPGTNAKVQVTLILRRNNTMRH